MNSLLKVHLLALIIAGGSVSLGATYQLLKVRNEQAATIRLLRKLPHDLAERNYYDGWRNSDTFEVSFAKEQN